MENYVALSSEVALENIMLMLNKLIPLVFEVILNSKLKVSYLKLQFLSSSVILYFMLFYINLVVLCTYGETNLETVNLFF